MQTNDDDQQANLTRKHNTEYLTQIKGLLQQHPGHQFTHTYSTGTNVSLWRDNLWHGEMSNPDLACHAPTFEEVVSRLKLNAQMDSTMSELAEAFREQV